MDGLSGMIGVSSSSLASFHLEHVMRGLKWPVSCSNHPPRIPLLHPCAVASLQESPRWPEGPSPQAGVAPAGAAEPLAKEAG